MLVALIAELLYHDLSKSEPISQKKIGFDMLSFFYPILMLKGDIDLEDPNIGNDFDDM
jgi:hypothetical protein